MLYYAYGVSRDLVRIPDGGLNFISERLSLAVRLGSGWRHFSIALLQ